MQKNTLYLIAGLLIVASLVLIVWGLQSTAWLWQAGLGVLTLAMLLSLLSRWVGQEQKETQE